ncbi:MAG: permease-like cell division protein FtsX [Firmicutes bacterium]|nr:permease-like cell division protein FtsX [Bacillota bacterium]MBQ9603999.1 permease-like cell division protein FtsX [Bacillota bacterium]
MKFRTFSFHLEQGVRSLLKNGIMSLASIGIVAACIFIVILSLCVAFNIDSILQQIENNIGIEIFFGNEPTEEQIARLEGDIRQQPHVVEVTYNSYDDALDRAKERLNMASLESLRDDNPLPRSFYISLDSIKSQKEFISYLEQLQLSFEKSFLEEKAAAGETAEAVTEAATENTTQSAAQAAIGTAELVTPALPEGETSAAVQAKAEVAAETTTDVNAGLNIGDAGYTYRGIEKIMHAQGATSTLAAIDTVVRVVSIVLVLLLCVVSVGIIMNTIKLTVFVRRNEISIMKYVGATDWFIRWPFIIEGLLIGIIGAIIPCVVAWYSYDKMISVIYDKAPIIKRLFQFVGSQEIFMRIVPVCLLLGALLGAIGSITSIRKHLNV